MPIYEYWCPVCRRRVSLYVRLASATAAPACPQCKGANLRRLFSTFAVRKSEMSTYEDILSDNQLVKGLEQNNPRALAEWNRRMGSGGDEGVGPEHEEMLARLEAGEMPPAESPDEEETSEESQ